MFSDSGHPRAHHASRVASSSNPYFREGQAGERDHLEDPGPFDLEQVTRSVGSGERQRCAEPFTKTALSMRTSKIGPECLAMLKRRRLAAVPGESLVFPSRIRKVLSVATLADTWRVVVKDIELEWSTLRTLRGTRATRVRERYGLPAAREILGHDEDSRVTSRAYVPAGRRVVNVADAR
jgi:hypothetical protein